MINETMTIEERMRPPRCGTGGSAPGVSDYGDRRGRLYGITQAEAWANHDVAREA